MTSNCKCDQYNDYICLNPSKDWDLAEFQCYCNQTAYTCFNKCKNNEFHFSEADFKCSSTLCQCINNEYWCYYDNSKKSSYSTGYDCECIQNEYWCLNACDNDRRKNYPLFNYMCSSSANSINTTTTTTTIQSSSDSNVTAIACGVVIPIFLIFLIGIVLGIYIKRRKVLREPFIVDPNEGVGQENINKIISEDTMRQKNQMNLNLGASNPKNYGRYEIDLNNRPKLNLEEEASASKNEASFNKLGITDDALYVKREKERKGNVVVTEGNNDIQKGFGIKENFMGESEMQNEEEYKQKD